MSRSAAWTLGPYLTLLAAMLVYSLHSLVLVLVHRRCARTALPRPALPARLPHVAVQLPVYNEANVVVRLLRATAALQWPRDRLTIQLLDDSDDGTTALAAQEVAAMQSVGLDVQHLRRPLRTGYKAGALAYGLTQTSAEFVAILDADFVPPADFLLRALPWLSDGDVAAVQGRWTHLNRSWSPLCRAQALAIDGHFAVEQEARFRAGWLLNFNGSAGVWRRQAIDDAGGWSADTLTEDLDLSYRAQLRGWKLVFDRDLTCAAELPTTLAAFKAQQRRWATGSIQTARKLLPRIWRHPLGLGAKLAATIHLTHYAVHPLVAATALLSVPCVLLPGLASPPGSLWQVCLPFGVATVGPTALYLYARHVLGLPVLVGVRDLSTLTLVGVGIALSNGRAVLAGLLRRERVFERTPKRGVTTTAGHGETTYRVADDGLRVAEWLLSLYCLATAVGLLWTGVWAVAPWLMLDAAGFAFVAAAGARQQGP